MLNLSIDPYPEVAVMAKRVVNTITVKVNMLSSVGVNLLNEYINCGHSLIYKDVIHIFFRKS